ncbi:TonB-dependent receptor [bacterium]|nr:TonB-dependent receptor [bacterium]
MIWRPLMKLFAEFLLVFALAPGLLRATPGSLTGTIRDAATREPVMGATVAVLRPGTGTIADGAVADDRGRYAVKALESGAYNVRFEMLSYKTIMRNRVVVRGGAATVLDVELELNPIEMAGVTVRPSYFEKAKDAAVSSQRMDFEEIIAQPGGSWDVQRAVQALPAVVSGADQDNEIIVRGGNYGENLFVLDNVEIANPNHFGWQGTGGGPVTMLNTDFVRQIDFTAGAFPARYGDKASSVMDIKYREGASDRFHAKADMGMAGLGATVEGPAGKGSYLFSARKSYLSLIASSFGLTAIPTYYDLQGKLAYQLTPRLKLSAIGIFGSDGIRIDPGEDAGDESDEVVDSRGSQYAAGATLAYQLNNGHAQATLSRTKNRWNVLVDDTLGAELYHNRSVEFDNALKLDATIVPWGQDELSAGLYVRRPQFWHDMAAKADTLDYYLYHTADPEELPYDTIPTGTVTEFFARRDARTWKGGGYVQYRHRYGPRLTVTTGLRYDHLAYTSRGVVSPRIGTSFHVTEATDLNLSYGRHHQSPDWYQLSIDTLGSSLRHKYTDQVVAGVEHLFADDVKCNVEAYYKDYRDVPVLASDTTADPHDLSLGFVNAGRGYAKGLEFFLQKKVKDNLWGTASYSYSVSRARDPRDPSREFDWDFDYRHVATLIAGYRVDFAKKPWFPGMRSALWYKTLAFLPLLPADESEASFRFRYLGGKPYTPQTYHREWRRWTVDPDQAVNSARMNPYRRFDIHIQRRWFYSKLSLLTYFEVENVFNTKNLWGYQYNGDGTRTEVYQFGRMIIGGFVLEF